MKLSLSWHVAERARATQKVRDLKKKLFGTAVTSSESEGSDTESEVGGLGEMLQRLLGGSFPASIRKTAEEALRNGPEDGCNWIAGILLAWTSPPTVREVERHVQEHFPRPIQCGDVLSEVDGRAVQGLSRREILGLLKNFKGSLSFRRVEHAEAIQDSARKAIETGPEEDPDFEEGRNWIWGILLAWTSPPMVRAVKPEVQEHFERPIVVGDVLSQVDGKDVAGLSRSEVLERLKNYKGRIGFKSSKDDFRKSAQDALRDGPEEDLECSEGCNWVGGIRLAWTSPPVVREVKPQVQNHFRRPISAGDILHEVDGQQVQGLCRAEILKLISKHKSLCFRDGFDMDDEVRKCAREALKTGSEQGCSWIGGILLAWSSPPTVRAVKPEVQRHFPKPISRGDVLRQVDGQRVEQMDRKEILELLKDFQGSLGFRSEETRSVWLCISSFCFLVSWIMKR